MTWSCNRECWKSTSRSTCYTFSFFLVDLFVTRDQFHGGCYDQLPPAGAGPEPAPQCGETWGNEAVLPGAVLPAALHAMPHVVLERIRNAPFRNVQKDSGDSGDSRSRLDVRAAYMIEGLELGANMMFAVGSMCFLPAYAHDMDVFLLGCGLFVFGSFVYCCITIYTLCEAVHYHDNILNFESIEHVLYLLGSLLYLIGTLMYWPPEIDRYHMTWLAKHLSLGVYFNLFSTQFEGTILFMVGSAFFAFASFVNGLNQRSFDTLTNQLLTAVTSLYLGGALFFVMGSVAFLPDLGCNGTMVCIGATLYILGSLLLGIGSVVSIYRTSYVLSNPESQLLKPVGSSSSTPSIEDKVPPKEHISA